jgi:hypothetical protein
VAFLNEWGKHHIFLEEKQYFDPSPPSPPLPIGERRGRSGAKGDFFGRFFILRIFEVSSWKQFRKCFYRFLSTGP